MSEICTFSCWDKKVLYLHNLPLNQDPGTLRESLTVDTPSSVQRLFNIVICGPRKGPIIFVYISVETLTPATSRFANSQICTTSTTQRSSNTNGNICSAWWMKHGWRKQPKQERTPSNMVISYSVGTVAVTVLVIPRNTRPTVYKTKRLEKSLLWTWLKFQRYLIANNFRGN